MKFIGQQIHQFITRFRNDVYLEDIDSGVNGSAGGYLGLDGDNRIVKSTVFYLDNEVLKVGDDGDLNLIHNGTDSTIRNNTGDLYITQQADDSDIIFRGDDGAGGVETYFFLDGSNGLTTFPDNKKLGFGNASDLRIQHDGSNSYISQVGTGHLYIQNAVDDKDIIFQSDDGSGGTAEYFRVDGGAERVEFSKDVVISDISSTRGVFRNDNAYDLRLGGGTSYTDGAYISLSGGVRGGGTSIFKGRIEMRSGGSNYSAQADITGDIIMGTQWNGGTSDILTLDSSSGNVGIGTTSPSQKLDVVGDVKIHNTGSGNNATLFIDTVSGGNADSILNFREATVDRASLYWDGGDNDLYLTTTTGDFLINPSGNVGIGTASPSEKLEVDGNIKIGDSDVVKIGDGNDFTATHDGTDTFLGNNTGDLYITQQADDKDIIFRSDDGSGGVTEYFRVDGGSEKTIYTKPISLLDSVGLQLGTGTDAQIYHTGSEGTFINYTGNFRFIQSADNADISFYSDDGSGGTAEYFMLDGSLADGNNYYTKWPDNSVASFGSAPDLLIYHDGFNSRIRQLTTSDLIIENLGDDKDIIFKCDDGLGGTETYFRLDGSASSGDPITIFPDNSKLAIGESSHGITLVHDGSNSSITNAIGHLTITNFQDNGDIIFKSDDGTGSTTEYFRVDGGAEVTLFSKPIRIHNVDQFDNPRLSLGRQLAESINFDVEDRIARIYHKQDETTGSHELKLTVDSNTSDDKRIKLGFRDADGSNEATVFTVDSNNNVGIGTTSPSEKLEVDGNIKLSGNLDIGGSVQKQIQVFPMNFVDNLGTTKHFMPFVTNVEQTVNYQEEAAMVMPADGRVVSVTVHYAQMHGTDGNITIGIETSPCGQSYTNAWTVEETETIAASVADDHHVFHFAFDNAKHFESTDKMAISIQQSAAMQNANRFFWVTAVIEYDWSTFLGGTSAEYTTTP